MTWKVLLPKTVHAEAVLLIFVLLSALQPRQEKAPAYRKSGLRIAGRQYIEYVRNRVHLQRSRSCI